MTIEERVDAMCKWNNPGLQHLVIEEMKAAVEEDASRRADKLLAIGGGEIAHAAREAEREACASFLDKQAEGFQVLIDHAPTPIRAEDLKRVKHSIETVAKQIRARSERGE